MPFKMWEYICQIACQITCQNICAVTGEIICQNISYVKQNVGIYVRQNTMVGTNRFFSRFAKQIHGEFGLFLRATRLRLGLGPWKP